MKRAHTVHGVIMTAGANSVAMSAHQCDVDDCAGRDDRIQPGACRSVQINL